MKRLFMLVTGCAGLMMATACASMSNQEDLQARAAATCIDRETEKSRNKCMDTELAAMTALEREEQREYHQAQKERERRQAISQAYGAPESATREAYENRLSLPNGGRKR